MHLDTLQVLVMMEPCYALCPPSASIAPCVCSEATGLTIDCNFKSLSDFQVLAQILKLSVPSTFVNAIFGS